MCVWQLAALKESNAKAQTERTRSVEGLRKAMERVRQKEEAEGGGWWLSGVEKTGAGGKSRMGKEKEMGEAMEGGSAEQWLVWAKEGAARVLTMVVVWWCGCVA